MENTNDKIIVLPEFQQLKETVERLKTELSMLMLERDELRYVVCKNIEMSYCLKLGALEYKAFELQCTALRLKRKIDMIQARINRQEKVDVTCVEKMLDEEFAAYQKLLEEQVQRMNDAIERGKAEFLTAEDNRELKKLYRKIVKKLHPDVNPEVTEAQVRLLENAIEAYKSGDLNTLRIIGEMVGDSDPADFSQNAMRALLEEKKRIENLIRVIQNEIEEIKATYPYTLKAIVEDPEKEQERRKELEDIIAQYEALIEIYQARLDEMLG